MNFKNTKSSCSKLDNLLKEIAVKRHLLEETSNELFAPLRKIDSVQKHIKNQKILLFAAVPVFCMFFLKHKMSWANSFKSGNKLLIAWRLISYLKNIIRK